MSHINLTNYNSRKPLKSEEIIKIVESIGQGKMTVAQAAHRLRVSRQTVYNWLKRHKDREKSQTGYDMWRRQPRHVWLKARQTIPASLERRICQLVKAGSSVTPYKLYHEVKRRLEHHVGFHGFLNCLERNGLDTQEALAQFRAAKDSLPVAFRRRMVESVLHGQQPVSQVAKNYDISRQQFYLWIKRFEEEGDRGLIKKSSAYIPSSPLPQTVVETTLTLVSRYPELSYEKLWRILTVEKPELNIGRHAVYNLLKRYNLTQAPSRFMYATKFPVTPEPKAVQVIDSVGIPTLTQLSPTVLPGPPPPRISLLRRLRDKRLLATLVLSTFVSTVFFTVNFQLLNAYFSARSINELVGYIFATIALTFGTLFFLYSLKYYLSVVLVLLFSRKVLTPEGDDVRSLSEKDSERTGLLPDVSQISLDRHPFVSIHLPLYNEKRVVNRLLEAVTSMDYDNYEVVVCDDSTDETKEIVLEWRNHPKVKISHRLTREGFKGGALSEGLKLMDKRTEFVLVYDADFLPFPDTLTQFLRFLKSLRVLKADGTDSLDSTSSIAAIQGYQWHVLNKSENWITRGVRSEYAGSYVVERSSAEVYRGLKQIAGSVFMIRADILRTYDWSASITEDFELTLKLYRDGYKVVYTPYIQAPSECVSTIKRLVRQRMRWAEGHSHNIHKYFKQLMFGRWSHIPSQKINSGKHWIPSRLSLAEKLEFMYLSPYYLQSFFFLLGTLFWFLSETVFSVRLPFWTAVWGWSLVLTNMLSLPLMNLVGMFLEEAEEKDYLGLASFILMTYLVAPFQAYASVKGFMEKEEGPWFRTPKTGKITDIYRRGRFYRWLTGLFGQSTPVRPVDVGQRIAVAGLSVEVGSHHRTTGRSRKKRWIGNGVVSGVLLAALLVQVLAGRAPGTSSVSLGSRFRSVEVAQADDGGHQSANHTVATEDTKSLPAIFTYETRAGAMEQIFHREPRVRLKYQNRELEIVPAGSNLGPAQHREPSLNRTTVTYPEIFTDIDLLYHSGSSGFTEEFILKEYHDLTEIKFVVRMVGLVPQSAHGTIQFVDDTNGEVVFTLPPPYMYEQPRADQSLSLIDLSTRDVAYSLGIEYEMHKTPIGWVLTKRLTEVGKQWLADPERQFPVVIDPSVVVSGGIVDGDVQFGGLQRKVAYVNGNWYAFHNDGGQPLYKKSSDGVSWGSNVNVDATEADADNYNPSIWVKSNVIWVAWIDDSAEDIEFRSIDTASADALGTKCTSNLGAITIGSTNMVSIAVQNTGTDIYVAQSDTGADTEVHLLQSTSGCTFTDRTTGSGLTAGDRPVLVRSGDDALVVFQDGNLSYSHWNASDLSWVASNITVSADTDTTYSVTSDGTTAWVLVQSGTTATTFYRLGQFERTIDTGTGLNKAHVDIDCPATDNCKILYMDIAGGAGAIALKFVDCNDAACSAPTITEVDGTAGATAFAGPLALDCPAPDDCKYAYFEGDPERLAVEDCDNEACSTQGATAVDAGPGMDIPSYVDIYCLSTTLCKVVYVQSGVNDLKFVNCTGAATNVCLTNANNILDADVGELGGYPSVFCPTDTDCKVVYYDANTNGSILFADCNAAACTSATLDATSTLDSNVGIGDTVFVSLNCSAAATECRVVYYDGTDNDVTFVDCAADADCSPANCDTPTNCTDIDSDVGTIGSPVRVDCDGGGNPPTDCKVLYYDGTDQDVTFVDCGSEDCATNTITDIDTDVGPDSAFVGIDCSLGATPTDCRIAYNDGSDNDITYVDCEDGDCSAPDSSRDIDSAVESEYPFLSMDCGSDSANCKLVYHDTSEQDLTFVDCNDETCSAPATSDIDTSVGRTVVATSIDCPASGNCKVVYVDYLVSTLFFVDCNDESCSAPPGPTTIDSGILRGTNRNSIDCPAAGDCKIVYHDDTEADMTYVDCNDETCSAPSAVDLDTSVSGVVLVSNDIDCTLGATDCRIVFFDKSANTYTHVDCGGGTPTDCSTNTQLVLNTDTPSTGQQDGGVNIECFSGATTDCKVAFHEEDIDDITFIDCATTSCCTNANCTGVGETATVTTIDADVDGAGGGGNNYLVMGVSLACASASECALIYKDLPDATYYFVDCDSADCSTRTTVPLTTIQGAGGAIGVMDCLTDNTNCKIFYSDSNNSRVRFTDCIGDTCNLATLTAPWTGQTNVLGVSISYDSTNDDIYAHIIMDATEQAYFKSTDASTISWSAQASYGFSTGDLNHISAPMSGAGSTQIGVTLRQGSNYEFAAVPETWQTVLVSGLLAMGWLRRKRRKR